MHRGNVVHALGNSTGQFLEARKAIEFEGIEAFGSLVDHAGLYLRFRLDLDFAHLGAQSDDTACQFEQVCLERT